MKFCNATKLSSLLTEISEPQKQIISYITSLKQRGLSYNSVSLPLYAIYHFYEINDVPLNKKKINMFKGEFLRKVSDRAYRYDEIKKLLDISDLRMKSIISFNGIFGNSYRINSITKIKKLAKDWFNL